MELVLCSRSARPDPEWLTHGTVVTADLSVPFERSLLEGVDTVVHLAALNEIVCGQNPVEACEVNCTATVRLLEQAVAAGVRRLVYFSTARVYQEPLVGHFDEGMSCRPPHPYGISHKGAEDYLLAAHQKGKLEVAVLRLANGVGYPMDVDVDRWTLLVNDLSREVVRSGKVTLRSTGLQPRNFIPLHDVARAVNFFIHLPVSKLGDGVFNLAGRESETVWDMTQRVARCAERVLGRKVVVERKQPENDEVSEELDYSVEKLIAAGFTFEGSLETEIEKTIELCLKSSFGE